MHTFTREMVDWTPSKRTLTGNGGLSFIVADGVGTWPNVHWYFLELFGPHSKCQL